MASRPPFGRLLQAAYWLERFYRASRRYIPCSCFFTQYNDGVPAGSRFAHHTNIYSNTVKELEGEVWVYIGDIGHVLTYILFQWPGKDCKGSEVDRVGERSISAIELLLPLLTVIVLELNTTVAALSLAWVATKPGVSRLWKLWNSVQLTQ